MDGAEVTVDGYEIFINNENKGCDTTMAKHSDFTLEQCKQKCDDNSLCQYFSMGSKCRTHKKCALKDAKESRNIYKKITVNDSKGIRTIRTFLTIFFIISKLT